MNLSNFEKGIPTVIMQRGRGYTQAVHDLEETEPEFWQAYVDGSHTYDIEIQMDGQEITHWSCSCPYDGPICKHVAATLLCLRAEKASTSATSAKRPTQSEQVELVLSKMQRADLEGYVRQLLQDDRTLREKFLLRFQPPISGMGEAPAKRYRRMLDTIIRQNSSSGFIDYDDADRFSDAAQELFDTLSQSSLTANDKIDVTFALIEGLSEAAENMDDSDGYLSELMYAAQSQLEAAYPELTTADQQQLFLRVLEAAGSDDYGVTDNLDKLLKQWAMPSPHFQNIYLQALEKAPHKTSFAWQHPPQLRERFDLLKTWGRLDEALALAAAHLEVFEFREWFVKSAIAAKDFTKARRLITDALKQDEKNKIPGRTREWRAYLLEIAYTLDDKPAIRTELENVFKESFYNLDSYQKLKATYTAEEWQANRDRYYALVPQSSSYDPQRAAILKEEQDLPALYELIKAHQATAHGNERLFKTYAPVLAPAFPDEIPLMYASLVCDYLQQNTGRSIYQQTIDDLQVLSKMPGGEAMVANLVRGFCDRYKTRKVMVEMLREAFKF